MEKKQLISVVKPLIAAALLFGSSGGVAWGQNQMVCGNAFGAGESRSDGSVSGSGYIASPPNRGTTNITSDLLVADGSNTPVLPGISSIIIGTSDVNVVGERWVFNNAPGGGWINTISGYHIGMSGNNCWVTSCCAHYDSNHDCDDWRGSGWSPTGRSWSHDVYYTGCDNTFFRNHGGSFSVGNAEFASSMETAVIVSGGSLENPATSLPYGSNSNALDFQQFYFTQLPWTVREHVVTATSVPYSNGCSNCNYWDVTGSSTYTTTQCR